MIRPNQTARSVLLEPLPVKEAEGGGLKLSEELPRWDEGNRLTDEDDGGPRSTTIVKLSPSTLPLVTGFAVVIPPDRRLPPPLLLLGILEDCEAGNSNRSSD